MPIKLSEAGYFPGVMPAAPRAGEGHGPSGPWALSAQHWGPKQGTKAGNQDWGPKSWGPKLGETVRL